MCSNRPPRNDNRFHLPIFYAKHSRTVIFSPLEFAICEYLRILASPSGGLLNPAPPVATAQVAKLADALP